MESLTSPFQLGLDAAFKPDQAVPHPPFIEELFSFATSKDAAGKPLLTTKDLSRILGKRRAESKATNKEYSLRFADRIFSSAKCVVAPSCMTDGHSSCGFV